MNIKKGDYYSRVSYGKITEVNGSVIFLENENGERWSIDRSLVEKEFNLASDVSGEEKVTQTELSTILTANAGTIMTVNFSKKVDEKKAAELIQLYISKADGNGFNSTKELSKVILKGEERTIIGRHYNHVDEFGRVQFVDMELAKDSTKDYDVRLRKVDPRTINWITVKGVKYVKK